MSCKVKKVFDDRYIKIVKQLESERKLKRPRLSQEVVADTLGMTYVQFNKKINLHYDFTLDEIIKFADILDINLKEIIKNI